MTPSLPLSNKEATPLLAEFWAPLLLMAVALFFVVITGISTILQGEGLLVFSYWQCVPILIASISVFLFAQKGLGLSGILAGLALFFLSPFPTWASRIPNNTYFTLCTVGLIASALWLQLSLCHFLESTAYRNGFGFLAKGIQSAKFWILAIGIIPVSAVYCSSFMGLFTGTIHSLREALQIWDYGRISLILRLCMFCTLCQFLRMCLHTLRVLSVQMKLILDASKKIPEENTPSQDKIPS